MNFFKTLLASILGFFIAIAVCFIFFLLFISIMAGTVMGSSKETISIEDNSVLELSLSEPLVDYGERVFFKDFDITNEEYNGLNSVLKAIKNAKNSDETKKYRYIYAS